MKNLLDALKNIWAELEPVMELFIYLGIAKLVSFLFGITYLQAIAIVYIYFILSLARIAAEIIRSK